MKVKFKIEGNKAIAAFYKNDFLVYSQMGVVDGYTKSDYLQKLYEISKESIDYESHLHGQGKDNSIPFTGDISDYEEFIPQEPRVSKIDIIGDKEIHFTDEDLTEQKREYKVIAYDQYGDIFSEQIIEHIFTHDDYTDSIEVEVGGITKTIDIQVVAYKEPAPSETDLIRYNVERLEQEKQMLEFQVNALTQQGEILEGAIVELASLTLE